MQYLTIKDAKIKNQVALVRVDYNVPLDEQGRVLNDLRIRASLPTLQYLREKGAKKIILISHLGRPEGRDKALSLAPVAKALEKLIQNVSFVDDVSGPDVEDAVKKLKNGAILLLENLRFFSGEKANSDEFIREIVDSTAADFYVQDGFAVVHRAHASTVAIANYLPVYAGLLLEKEITNLEHVVKHPARPLLLVVGGAKVDDKSPLINRFVKLADNIFVGGKIAATGYQSELKKVYIAEDFDEDASGAKLDVGPLATIKLSDQIKEAKTIVWNGLLGKAEDPAYATASTIAAELIGEKDDAASIICGGDTTAFVEELQKTHPALKYTLISTGGGAALEFLSGAKLPGLSVIEQR